MLNFLIAAILIFGVSGDLYAQSATEPSGGVTVTAPVDPTGADPAKAAVEAAPMEIKVQAKRIQPQASFDRVEKYDAEYIDRSEAFTAGELLKSLPPGPPGTK